MNQEPSRNQTSNTPFKSSDYPIGGLNSVAATFKGLGYLTLIGGIILSLVIYDMFPSDPYATLPIGAPFAIYTGIMSFIAAMVFFAVAEIIRLLDRIELNTRLKR